MRPIGLVEHGLCLRCCNGEAPRGPLTHRFRLLRPFRGWRAGDLHAIKFASYRLENERRTPSRLLGRLRRGPRWLVTSGCLRSSDWAAPPACACYVEQTVRRHNSDWMVPPARACNVEQAMRRHGSAVYVVALAQTRCREDARCFARTSSPFGCARGRWLGRWRRGRPSPGLACRRAASWR